MLSLCWEKLARDLEYKFYDDTAEEGWKYIKQNFKLMLSEI